MIKRLRYKYGRIKYESKSLFKVLAHSIKSLRITFPVLVVGLIFIAIVIFFFGGIYFLNSKQFTEVIDGKPIHHIGSYWDGLYFSAITYFTIGFGDISPLEQGMRNIAVIEAMIAFVTNMIISGLILNQLIKPVNYLEYGNKLIINDKEDGYEVSIRLHLINRAMWLYNLNSKLILITAGASEEINDTEAIMQVNFKRDIYRGIIELKFSVDGDEYEKFRTLVRLFDSKKEMKKANIHIRLHTTAQDSKGSIHHKSIKFEPKHYTNCDKVNVKSVVRNKRYKNCLHYEERNGRLHFIGITEENLNAIDSI